MPDSPRGGDGQRCTEPPLGSMRERMVRSPDSLSASEAGKVGRHILNCRACLKKSLRGLEGGGGGWLF